MASPSSDQFEAFYVVERQTRVAERRSDFFRPKFITACLVIVSYSMLC